MTNFASSNLEIVISNRIKTPSVSQAALYGKGIFTTLAIFDRNPFRWEGHWFRLTVNAAKIGIDLVEFTQEATRAALDKLIVKNGIESGRARLTFLDESPGRFWAFEAARATHLIISTDNSRPIPKVLRLGLSKYPVNSRSPLAGVKSCNYLENIMAADEAKKRGFDEAIRLNERGEVTSSCMANVFWVMEGILYTPGLNTGCLPGTTREYVIENLDCSVVEAGIDALTDADSIFLTSAGLGIVEVSEFGSKKLEKSGHPIMDLWPPQRQNRER